MKPQRILAFTLLAVIATLVAVALWEADDLTGVKRLESLTVDLRQRITAEDRRADAADASDIVLVFFDEATVDGWPYEQPFPRSALAELIRSLSSAGASVIGLDVYLARLYPELDSAGIGGDEALRAAISDAGNVVLVAPTQETEDGLRMVPPHPVFAEAAARVASADLDNPFATAQVAALTAPSASGTPAPSFSLALWALHRGLDLDSLLAAAVDSGRVALPGLPPEQGNAETGFGAVVDLMVRYVGPPSHRAAAGDTETGTFTAFSASEVPVLAMFTPEFFADKIVLLGSGFHESDRFRTAFSDMRVASTGSLDELTLEWMYGVEIHANAIQNMLDGRYLDPVEGWQAQLFLLVAALVCAAGVALWGPGMIGGGGLTLAVGVGTFAAAYWLWAGAVFLPGGLTLLTMDHAFVAIPLVPTLLSATLSYLVSAAYSAVVEGREKRFIKGAFGKYVSPDVVAQISENPALLELGGQRRELSILFSDLSGFTTLSERMEPEALVAHLNEYLEEMTQLVLDTGGTLDKYIGDAIMAFWNAPIPREDHADRALRCAVLMQRMMNELNARWMARDDEDAEPLVVRIGVNSGPAVVGNVGGAERFDYSAIGDPVNLAARLEPANKSYDTLVMCSEYTLEEAHREDFRVRELDHIAVKGKTAPVRVYEVVEMADAELPPHRLRALERFDEGLAAYRLHQWQQAAAHFEAALDEDPDDGPARLYVERSLANAADPPPPDWDFVVRRTVK